MSLSLASFAKSEEISLFAPDEDFENVQHQVHQTQNTKHTRKKFVYLTFYEIIKFRLMQPMIADTGNERIGFSQRT